MAAGLLCFVWDEADCVTLRREPPAFLRDFPSGFECDLRLRPPRRKPTTSGGGAAAAGAAVGAAGGVAVAQSLVPSAAPLFLCRHVARCPEGTDLVASDGVPDAAQPPPHPPALVKSSLQKAVRRGLPRAAVAAAAYLLAREPKDLLRRLPLILAEDVGIFADLPRLTWLMIAVQSSYTLREADIRFVLTLVAFAAAHRERTHPPAAVSEAEADAVLSHVLQPTPTPAAVAASSSPGGQRVELIRQCLVLRACYGGMPGDIEMLLALAAKPSTWIHHIAPEAPPEAAALAEEWLAASKRGGGIGRMWAAELAPEARLEAAVDFHCSDIVPQVLRQLRSSPAPWSSLPSEEELKAAMWQLRSSVNCRSTSPPAAAGSSPVPAWWGASLEAKLASFSHAAWTPRRPVASVATSAAAPAGAKRQKTGGNSGGSASRQLSILRFAAPAVSAPAA